MARHPGSLGAALTVALYPTDDDRFLDGRGAGLYETPRIYGERLPDTRATLTVPQFYHVGRGDRETSGPLGRAIQSGDHDAVREVLLDVADS